MGVNDLRTGDGLRLFTRRWAPAAPPRGSVVLVHGYAEHSGRYDSVARAFAEEGLQTYAFDLRGHGQSEGPRAYVDTFEHYLADLHRFLKATRPHAATPLFLFGHSMGGLIVLKYALDRSPAVRGLVLSAPALEINADLAPILRRFAHTLGRIAPTLPTVRSPQGAISRDPAVVADAEDDPLNYHGRAKARTGAEMLRAGANVRDRLDAVTTPFLVVHGTADLLTSPAWSRRLHERAGSPDKTIRLYEGLYHETFNEPEREIVLNNLRTWVTERIP